MNTTKKPSKEAYVAFVTGVLRRYFPDTYKLVRKENNCIPLTSRKIAMRANDLLCMYYILCDILQMDIIITDVSSFRSVDSIAEMLMSYRYEDMYEAITNAI